MDAVHKYATALSKAGIVTDKVAALIWKNTIVKDVDIYPHMIILQFETKLYCGSICQYVTYRDEKFHFRDSGAWFIPGDIVFNHFDSAFNYLKEMNGE